MADFHQTGVVTTLHRLKRDNVDRLEAELEGFSRNRPIGLVLPALYSEFETPAMHQIVSALKQVRYLERIVVALGRATKEQYLRARSFFADFYTPVTILWLDGERMQDLLRMLEGPASRPAVMARAVPAGWRSAISSRGATAMWSPCMIATS